MIEFDFELDYFDQVENDIEIAKLWYYEQNPDTHLEEPFANAIKDTITKLQKNPFIYTLFLKIFASLILNFSRMACIL